MRAIPTCIGVAVALSICSIAPADGATRTSTTSVAQDYRIHHSHVFHAEPQAIITSVISDIRRQPINQLNNDDGVSTLDIDVSSTRLDDGGVVSLMEELVPLLQAKSDEAKDSQSDDGKKQPLMVKITLAMNKITPSGSSKLFNALIGDSGDEKSEEILNGTAPAVENSISEENGEANEDEVAESEVVDATTTNDEEDLKQNIEKEEEDESAEDSTDLVEEDPLILVEELDLSFNDIGGHGMHPPNAKLLDSARRLFESEKVAFIPRILTLENCGIGPAFCRSIGRGILNAYESKINEAATLSCRPSVLRIGGNTAIADAGCVAIAAALRMAIVNNDSNHVLEELDLSSCDVGDAGAEALALAISSNPGCLCRLNLSNNKISNAGVKALGRALIDAGRMGCVFDEIILDNNDVSDDGARVLADALACGSVKSMSLRSCKALQAPGASAFGQAIMSLANRNNCGEFKLDLSGNHFGTRTVKKKKGAAKYSAKATTSIKFIGKTLTSAAKRFSSDAMGLTADSDDDEEVMGGLVEEEDIDENKIQACGGHAFAGEILRSDQHHKPKNNEKASISVGMRQCFLDDGAIDALAASIVAATNCKLSVDIAMNAVEEKVVEALMGKESDSKSLSIMAKRHMDFLDRLADSRQRQMEAAEAATSSFNHDLGGSFFDDEDVYDAGSDDQYDDFF